MTDNLDPDDWSQFVAQGHRMLDDAMEFLRTVRERPVWRPVPAHIRADLDEPLPREGSDLGDVYTQFLRDVLPYPTGNIHPRFWGWVMGNGTPLGVLAEMLAATMNAHVGGYDQSASLVERRVLRWLSELLGLPPESSGLLVSGGTSANLVGLATARSAKAPFDVRERGVGETRMLVYASTETHSWAWRSCALLGLGRDALRSIPVNADSQIDVEALRETIERDRAAGGHPICVIGNAGTVNTGATDDLRALRAVCDEKELWLHVDGAFGALAALVPSLRDRVAGLERADSIAFDLHKWGYLQYEIGCVLIRDRAAHQAAFGSGAAGAAYLVSPGRGVQPTALEFSELGPQLTRGFRALKVWMSLKVHGANAWAACIERNVRQAQYLASRIDDHPSLERLAPVPLNLVCFRFVDPKRSDAELDDLNREILVRLQEEGIAVPSSTLLRGRFAIRVAITNYRSVDEDFDLLVESVVRIGRQVVSS